MKQVLDPATHDRHVRGKKHAVARRASTVRTGFIPKIWAGIWIFVKIRTRDCTCQN